MDMILQNELERQNKDNIELHETDVVCIPFNDLPKYIHKQHICIPLSDLLHYLRIGDKYSVFAQPESDYPNN